MTNSEVEVPFGDDATVTAQNLLAAAERLGEDASVVRTTSKGHFTVPDKVAKEAESYSKGGDKPAKKAAAKKAPAKKTAAKKAPAKKAAPSSEASKAADTTEAQE